MTTRRQFLRHLATASGAVVLVPAVSRCAAPSAGAPTAGEAAGAAAGELAIPLTRAADWDPMAYNRARGLAGAIPDSYLGDITGPDGDAQHLGKHLPYVPAIDAERMPADMLAIMWGDPAKGHAKHPNAVRSEANNHEGHWYNWIRVRKATAADAEELQSAYSEWPGVLPEDNGAYAVFGGGDITAESGKNTIYLAALPSDVQSGDWVRIHAHCLTHGEYVDFLQVP